ncbi:MAG TPA: hypothetical protein VFV87_00420 [Pirellulaceae bacterium]|nr:hypothetical protein [Pirellulaceae bacterium]
MFRYSLRTLLMVLAVAPPVIAYCFLNRDGLALACGWSVIVGIFLFWNWMVDKTASLGDQARGKPNHDPPKHFPP